jgi:DNA-binding NtrC family response regulator
MNDSNNHDRPSARDISTRDLGEHGTLEIAVFQRNHGWLMEVQDDDGGKRVPLNLSRMIVGSGPTADIVVRDPTVSAKHCALSVLGSGVAIEDLGSKNGTFVGTARVREAWGGAGTTITIGNSTVVCLATDTSAHELEVESGEPLHGVAGGSAAMLRVANQTRRLSKLIAPVLIAGESGTGKELIARALHHEGPRASGPFIAINVAALPRELVESEMFGHERGAFTGATTRREGAFVEAEGGTLFLDEIGELPLDAQPKLLRALDGYEVRRIGSVGGGSRANVRVVAATHAPLEERVSAGLFRRDLFHRLEVFVIEVPPLRARRGDIAAIARELLTRAAREIGRRELTSSALARLVAHDWPGNVRELRNVLFRAADTAHNEKTIDGADVDRAMWIRTPTRMTFTPESAKAWLLQHGNNLSAAARSAGYPRTTFRKMLG